MKKKITLCMVLSTFVICAISCLASCSNDDVPAPIFTSEALVQTTWNAQREVYNTKDNIEYTEKSILQFITDSKGIKTTINEEDDLTWKYRFYLSSRGKDYHVRQNRRHVDGIGIHRYTPRNGSL